MKIAIKYEGFKPSYEYLIHFTNSLVDVKLELHNLKLSMLAQLSLVRLVFHNNVFAFIT